MERSVNRTEGTASRRADRLAPIGAGIVCSLVGFMAAFAVVLSGLRAVGATASEAASGLLAVTVMMGASSLLLSLRYRMPLTAAWSTPGAALLMSTGAVVGGWPAAVGAFLACGALLAVTGLWPGLSSLVQRIPAPIAQAMLAGILLPLCIAPVSALVSNPLIVTPILATWLLVLALRPVWAVPAALVTALIAVAVSLIASGTAIPASALIPQLEPTMPAFTLQALTGIALPLYLVTMASQNLPGVAVLHGLGFQAPWRPALAVTGAASLLAAPLGGHAVNLAAISASLAAGPEAGPKERRWIAGVTAGIGSLTLGLLSTGLAAVMLAAPPEIVRTAAGVALLGTFASAAASAMEHPSLRLPAAITLLVAASGVSAAGLSSAFWSLAAGIVSTRLLSLRPRERGTRGGAEGQPSAEPTGKEKAVEVRSRQER